MDHLIFLQIQPKSSIRLTFAVFDKKLGGPAFNPKNWVRSHIKVNSLAGKPTLDYLGASSQDNLTLIFRSLKSGRPALNFQGVWNKGNPP